MTLAEAANLVRVRDASVKALADYFKATSTTERSITVNIHIQVVRSKPND